MQSEGGAGRAPMMPPPSAPLQDDGTGGGDLPIPAADGGPAVLVLPDDHPFIAAAPLRFVYFPLFARVAPAVALAHSGLPWTGAFPNQLNEGGWKALKPLTPWGELPILENTEVGTIGHEATILAYIAKKAGPALQGADLKEQMISMQLMGEAEDIYQKLGRLKNGGTDEQKVSFWADADPTKHNRDQGLAVYLMLLEKFHAACGAPAGYFTASGITVGECKLWTLLHICQLCKENVFEGFPACAAFYERFTALPPTQELIETGGPMGGQFAQYFMP